jgi:hypothetical protein
VFFQFSKNRLDLGRGVCHERCPFGLDKHVAAGLPPQ